MSIPRSIGKFFSSIKLTAAYLFSPGGIMSDSNAKIDLREMEETYNYPQAVIDSLYEEGDLDYIFLCDLLGNFDNASRGDRTQERTDFPIDPTLEKALLLANFLIGSHDFAGFHMKEYGKIDITFSSPEAFKNFVKKSFADDVDYVDRISTGDRYTVGLIKIHKGKKAPPIPREIEKIIE